MRYVFFAKPGRPLMRRHDVSGGEPGASCGEGASALPRLKCLPILRDVGSMAAPFGAIAATLESLIPRTPRPKSSVTRGWQRAQPAGTVGDRGGDTCATTRKTPSALVNLARRGNRENRSWSFPMRKVQDRCTCCAPRYTFGRMSHGRLFCKNL